MPVLVTNGRSKIYNVTKDTHLRLCRNFGGGSVAVEVLSEDYEWEPLTHGEPSAPMVYTAVTDKFLRFTGSARVSLDLTGATAPELEYHFYGAPEHSE